MIRVGDAGESDVEQDKVLARERARDLWRYMQLIEASRHRAEMLELMAHNGPQPDRTVLAEVAAQLRDFADQLHALWERDQAAPPARVRDFAAPLVSNG
jgi:hypothetical protein